MRVKLSHAAPYAAFSTLLVAVLGAAALTGCGGGSKSSGTVAPATATVPAVVVYPGNQGPVAVPTGNEVVFTGHAVGLPYTAVVWSLEEQAGGTIEQGDSSPNDVVYFAPYTGGTYHLIATSVAEPSVYTVVTVVVSGPPPGSVPVTVSMNDVSRSVGSRFTADAC
jgi:hypothetical protein